MLSDLAPTLRGEIVRTRPLIVTTIIAAMLHGAVIGSSGGRAMQIVFSAIKLPLLLTIAFALSVPCFFVLNTLLGLRDDLGRALRALLIAQAALVLTLASLSPLVVVWYASFEDHNGRILFNAMVFAIASAAAQLVLRREYRELITINPAHRRMLWTWLIVHAFVAVQAAWVLRPFIGDPGRATQFFRADAWSNAYVWLIRAVWGAI